MMTVRERWEAKQRQEDERDTDKEAPQKKPGKSPLIAEPQTNKQEERREELMRATKSDAGREQESTGRKRLIPEEEEGDDGAGKEPTTKRARYGEDPAATKERNGQPVEIKFVSNGGASAEAGALLSEVLSKILAVAPNLNVTVTRR